MRVLGIETSCDETGIAIYDTNEGLLAESLYTQAATHASFGGVVPELASRDHVRKLAPLLDDTLQKAELTIKEIEGIAYTKGPGLAGALLTGAMLGRTLGYALKIPTIGIHHLEGHLLAPFLEEKPPQFPLLALLVSGGHTALIQVERLHHYTLLGETLDDAVGEAFDKTAKLLGLGYPGGAALAKLAEKGLPKQFSFPRPMLDRPGLDFSFSGLKTAVLQATKNQILDEQTKANIACAFEEAIVETLLVKCSRALQQTGYKNLVVAGGVGANRSLRLSLQQYCEQHHIAAHFPRPEFCTDNGAMIAYAGALRLLKGEQDELGVTVRAQWPLEELND